MNDTGPAHKGARRGEGRHPASAAAFDLRRQADVSTISCYDHEESDIRFWISFVPWEPVRCDGANLQAAARRPGSPPEPKPSQRCSEDPHDTLESRKHTQGSDDRKTALSIRDDFSKTFTNLLSPTGPTTRPPKSTPSRAARHYTWSSRSAAAAREKIDPNNDEARTTNGDGRLERKHNQSDLRRKESCFRLRTASTRESSSKRLATGKPESKHCIRKASDSFVEVHSQEARRMPQH